MACFIFEELKYLLLFALFINIKQTISRLILWTSAHLHGGYHVMPPEQIKQTSLVCVQHRDLLKSIQSILMKGRLYLEMAW